MKGINFIGRSLDALKSFPNKAKQQAGYQLDKVQRGQEPTDWKPMSSIGLGVREIRISEEGQYRVIYIVKIKDTVQVLHAFRKKTQKTSKTDIDKAKRNFKEVMK